MKMYSFLSGERYFVQADSLESAKALYSAILGDTEHGFTEEELDFADEGCETVTLYECDDWEWRGL